MARPGRPSRVAPAALKHSKAPAAAASAGRRIDSYGRVSKRVAPSGTKTTTTALAVRPEIAERLLAEKQKEHVAIDLPLLSSASPTKPSQPHNPSTTLTKQRKRRASEAIDADISPSSIPEQARTTATKRARRTSKATTSIADLLTRSNNNNNNKNTKPNTTATQPFDDSDSDSPASSFGDKAGKPLARLNLQSSLASTCAFPSPPRSASSSPQPASTASTTPYQSETEAEAGAQVKVDVALPAELLDLVHLQAAFVKALTLHLSHHGASTPVDVSVLCPNVAQSWGKRQVTLEDVQRCIGTATAADNSNGKGIFLCDYSRGKICIELQPDVGAVSALCAQLNKNFESVLCARWSAALRQGHGAVNTTQFIASLPRAPVTQCASLLQTSALRAKGQRSLEELMHGIALKKQERAAQDALLKAPVTAAAGAAGPPAAGAPMNLLDRIRFRQLQRAQLQASGAASAAPTPEELERRAALQRAGDIAEVLTMLCAASSAVGRPQSRVSFGMTAVLTKIKDSLRVPIAREEAASCVRLLAKEVAPQWLQLVSMGGREIVIMLPNLMPSKTAIQSQVQRLS
ncbi:hypothetical protein SPI_00865 [Niveomyces insectorum RCEF 264]|uniref:DNA replication factor Cdt1 C-terminal domain-containing protein n=1 Tax=Niveomyces insectorum RCEF 264 TaxID=1081102 RepID=A0A168AFG9_9HYPO|nr:hypothetical protein SPI_00865 [Niveomyces insectorum RCEF 264]